MTFWLKHIAKGEFVAATALDRQRAAERFHEGEALRCDLVKDRSSQQNRAFFAAIRKAWENQRGELYPSPEYLRAYAFWKVGFFETAFTKEWPEDTSDDQIRRERAVLETAISATYDAAKGEGEHYVFIRTEPRGLYIDVPKSWAFNATKHKEATTIMQDVLEFLVAEVCPGITVEQLVTEARREVA